MTPMASESSAIPPLGGSVSGVRAPKVSVVIPNYNHARYLPQRIASVLEQTFADFEVLLMDDASTDESREVIPALIAGDERVRTLYKDTNGGSGYKQWNRGVREARGEYVWIAESDDWAELRLLEKLVGKLDANPKIGVAYCQSWRFVEETGERYNNVAWTSDLGDRWERDFIADGLAECRRYLCQKNTIPNASAVVFRRDVYLAAGGAPEGIRLSADWLLWLKMLKISDLAYIAEPLNWFRQVSGSVTDRTKRDGTIAAETYDAARWILQEFDIDPEVRELICDKAFYVWTHPQFVQGKRLTAARNREIYRKAKTIDSQMHQRLIRRFAQEAARQSPGLSPLWRFARRAASLPKRWRRRIRRRGERG